jgi:hypothetical protein
VLSDYFSEKSTVTAIKLYFSANSFTKCEISNSHGGEYDVQELSSGLYCRLKWLSTDVSEVRTASIIFHQISLQNAKIPLRFHRNTGTSRSRVSLGSIVSDYVLDDRAIGVRSPAGAKDFSSILLCPDRLWCPPSLLYNGYRGSFPRGKERQGREADHSSPSSAEIVNEQELYSSSPKRLHGV